MKASNKIDNRGYIKIDTKKMEQVLKSNGFSHAQLAEKIGRTDSWTSGVLRRGTMHTTDYLAFKAAYGVDLALPVEQPKKNPQTCEEMLGEILIQLNKVVAYIETKEVLS